MEAKNITLVIGGRSQGRFLHVCDSVKEIVQRAIIKKSIKELSESASKLKRGGREGGKGGGRTL